MSASQWHDDQSRGDRAMREIRNQNDLASKLVGALRASGITREDAGAVQMLYALAGQSGSHRIVSAMRAIESWLEEGGAR